MNENTNGGEKSSQGAPMFAGNHSIGEKSLELFREIAQVESLGCGTKIGMYGGGKQQLTPVITYQEGAMLRDIDGNEYLDIGGSMAAGNLGMRPQPVLDLSLIHI